MFKRNSKSIITSIIQNQFKSLQNKQQTIRYFSNNNRLNNNNNSNNSRNDRLSSISYLNNNNNISNNSNHINSFKYNKRSFGAGADDDEIPVSSEQTNNIYIFWVALITTGTVVAIYRTIENYKNSSTNALGVPTYDAILLLQDLYFGELKPSMIKGNEEFNKLTKNNYFLDEAGIRNHTTGDTTTLIVPIKQKKTRSNLGTINVDFVKEGKFMTVQNFYINAINGYHYPLEYPDQKIDTTCDRYSGRYTLEELLADPDLGYSLHDDDDDDEN